MAGTHDRASNAPTLRRLFWIWVGLSVIVAIYVGIAGPFASYIGEGRPAVALAVPALMIFTLMSGLGWLVYFVNTRRRRTSR